MSGEHSYGALLIAFLGGLRNMLLPCAIGVLPVMIGYVGGFGALRGWAVFRQTMVFILGFCLAFTALGVMAGQAEQPMAALIDWPWHVTAALTILVIGISLFRKTPMWKLPFQSGQIIFPFLLGGLLGWTSSPCGTHILTLILQRIHHEKDALYGGQNLFLYALGQSALVLVAGLFAGLLRIRAARMGITDLITRFSGGLLIVAGGLRLLYFTGWALDMRP